MSNKIRGAFDNTIDAFKGKIGGIRNRAKDFFSAPAREKVKIASEFVLDNAMYIIIITAIIVIAIMQPRFLSTSSIVNITHRRETAYSARCRRCDSAERHGYFGRTSGRAHGMYIRFSASSDRIC